MTETWGGYRSTGTQSVRVGIDWVVLGDPASGSVTIRFRYGIQHTQPVAQTQTVVRTGSVTGSISITAAQGVRWSPYYEVTSGTQYGSSGTRHLGAYISNHYTELVPSVDAYVPIPARPYELPNPPPSASVSRVSDTQQNLSWSTDYTPADGARPWSGVYVERWDSSRGSYVRIATLHWSGTSYSDTSTQDNRRYRYRLQSYNSAGRSSYTYTDFVATTPAAPTEVTASKEVADVTVQWSRRTYPEAVYEVHHAADGVWDASPLATTAAYAFSWPHESPDPTVSHTYRLRAKDEDSGLVSSYSAPSNTIELQAPPNAPTGLSPSSEPVDTNFEVDLTWQHNAVDGTAQTAYEVQHRAPGGSWTSTGKVSTVAQGLVLSPATYPNDASFEWQVRTWGQHADPSAWSTVAVVPTSGSPTVLLVTPSGGAHDESSLTVEWSYYDPEGTPQSQYRVTLSSDSGDVLETRTGYGTRSSWTFSRTLENGTDYRVSVEVRDGAGLWSSRTDEYFTVTYAPPPTPSVEATWDKGAGVVVVTVTNPPFGEGEVDTDHSRLYRAINDGPWVLIAEAVPPGGTVTDTTPIVGGVNHYRAVAVSTLPSSAESETVPVPVTAADADHWVYLNAGPGFSQVVRVRANAKLDTSKGRTKRLVDFGRPGGPLEFAGRSRTRTGSLSVRLAPNPDGASSVEEVEALADMPAPICLRTPLGQRWFVSLGDVSTSYQGITAESSWGFTVVDHQEG